MRLKIALIVIVALVLLALGFHPEGLPFFRGNFHFSDAVTSHWPNALFLNQSIRDQHSFPVWRETIMAGQPFAANPLNKTAYPFQWLAVILPPSLHLNILILIHLFVAGAGMWKWLYSLGLRVEAVFFSTIAYVLAPRMMAHLGAGHLDVIYALAWWPWLMWSVGQTVRNRRYYGLTTALIAALLFLADVRVSLFAFMTAGIYTIIELQNARSWKSLSHFLIAGIIGLLLTISLIVPLLSWQPYLTRAELTVNDAGLLSLEPLHLLGLILASQPGGVETLTYLGLPVLILSVVGLVSIVGLKRWFALVALLLIVLYAFGSNGFFWSLLVRVFPPLLWFRVPSRVWLILALLGPVFAGFGLHWLLNYVEAVKGGSRPLMRGHARLWLVGFVSLVMICGFFALIVLPIPKIIGLVALIGGGVIGVLLFQTLNGRISTQRLAVFLIALVVADLGINAYQWVQWRGQTEWLSPEIGVVERLLAEHPARIYSPSYSLEQQVAQAYGLRLFGGVDPFQIEGVVEAIEEGSGVQSRGYSVVLPPLDDIKGDDLSSVNQDAVMNTAILAEWDVSHVVAAYPISNARLQLLDVVNDVYIYSNLDYKASPDVRTIPDWPVGWQDLPDSAVVASINQITVTTWFVSSTAFVICILLILYRQMRGKRD